MSLDALKIFCSSQKFDYDVSLDLSCREFTQLFESVGYFLFGKIGEDFSHYPLEYFFSPTLILLSFW